MTEDNDKPDVPMPTESELRVAALQFELETARLRCEMVNKDAASYDERAERGKENDHLREADVKSAVAHRTRLDNHLEDWSQHVDNWDAHVAKCEAHMERQSKALEAIAEALQK